MKERSAKTTIQLFGLGSALMIPLSSVFEVVPFSPTLYSGITLVFVYFIANPRMLSSSYKENKNIPRQEIVIPYALGLGALLMILGLIEIGIGYSAT